jgi:hypothetical protein
MERIVQITQEHTRKMGYYFSPIFATVVVNKTIVKFGMSSHVFGLLVGLKESFDLVGLLVGFDLASDIIEEKFQVHTLLILDDYIV